MSRRTIALSVLGVAALAALAYGIHAWRYWARHVSTDDAFVEAHVSPVSALRNNSISPTSRAKHPSVSRLGANGLVPVRLSRP